MEHIKGGRTELHRGLLCIPVEDCGGKWRNNPMGSFGAAGRAATTGYIAASYT
jgi:hypothetical protein